MTPEMIRMIKEFREKLSEFQQEILYSERMATLNGDRKASQQLTRIDSRLVILDEELERVS